MAQAFNAGNVPVKARKGQIGKYKKWGYIFMLPFILVFLVFQAWPLIQTFYYSMFKYFKSGLSWIGPEFVGFDNFVAIFDMSKGSNILALTWNTLIMWVLGFVPQIIISLLLGAWFSDPSLRLKGQRFFKTVIYLPNLIMASAFAMLFFTLFSDGGPINEMLMQIGILKEPYQFLTNIWSTRGLVALMNFLMWFGNTSNLYPGILQDYITFVEADSDLRNDHIPDRWSADVRCTSDSDQR